MRMVITKVMSINKDLRKGVLDLGHSIIKKLERWKGTDKGSLEWAGSKVGAKCEAQESGSWEPNEPGAVIGQVRWGLRNDLWIIFLEVGLIF